jgi:hypothetical protein
MRKILIFSSSLLILLVQMVSAQASFSTKTDFTAGGSPIAIYIGDINGNGKSDIVVANYSSHSVSVLLNTTTTGGATPSFSAKTDFATGMQPYSIAVDDFNGDGLPDIAVANYSSMSFSVLLNTTSPGATTPSFSAKTDFAMEHSPMCVSIGDLNGDNKPDIAVADYGQSVISVFLNTTTPGAATPSFSSRIDISAGDYAYPSSVCIGDLNGDGMQDLVMTIFNYQAAVLLNTTLPGSSTVSFSGITSYAAGSGARSISLNDFNGDGKKDIAVANSNVSNVSILLNTTVPGATSPTFSSKTEFTTGNNASALSIGDLNGDGKPDLITANGMFANSNASVLLNTTTPWATSPTFTAKTDFVTGNRPYSVAIGDINGDDKPDFAVANNLSSSVSVYLNTTTIGVSTPVLSANEADFETGTSPYSVAISDINGNGMPDLAVANTGNNYVSVLLNTTTPGSAVFSFSTHIDFLTGSAPRSVALGDLNGDGKPDMVVANSSSISVSIYLNTTTPGASTPTFTTKSDFTTGFTPYSVSLCDLNGDGKLDLAVANYSSASASVFLNTTTPGASVPNFTAKTDFTVGSNPYSVSSADLNGDGKPDLVLANGGSNSISVLINTTTPGASAPTFTTKTDFTTGSNPRSVSIGDINGDGKPDLATANYNSTSASVFLNTTTPGSLTPVFSEKTDYTTELYPTFVSFGDFNGDFKPDIITADYFYAISVFLNTTTPGAGSPSFTSRTGILPGGQPRAVAVHDLNGDGKPDVAVGNGSLGAVSILLNGADLPLPVELTFFTASLSGSCVILNWQTETEVSNYGFDIERKVNKDWEKIGFVSGYGNSNSPKEYSFVDDKPYGRSKFQYRLKQIDTDGQFEYSDIVEAEITPDKFTLFQNYPNPFNPTTKIKYQLPIECKVVIKLYDLLGAEVMLVVNEVKASGFYEEEISAESLASGTYIYRIVAGDFVESKKMTLIK